MKQLLLVAVVALVGCGDDSVTGSSGAAGCASITACKIETISLSACTPYAVSTNNATLAAALKVTPSTVNCLAAAGSNCNNARKCLDAGMTPSACTGTSSSCTGTVLGGCATNAGTGGNKGTTQFDCAAVSEMCVVNGAAADCGYGSCAAGTASSCVGSKVQTCNAGILQQTDCAQIGATCVVGTLGNAHCRGTGASCTGGITTNATGTPLRCDGTTLVTCLDSQEAKFDCAADNQQCLSAVGGQPFGCALGNACDSATFAHTCSGNKLTFCNDGLMATFDCGAAGYSGCDPNAGTCVP